jgi:predicted AlkP superfamily pyrophosphatase or phosphodiesterase
LKGNSTLFIVSDHGFAPYDRIINTNVYLKNEGFIDVDKEGKATSYRVRAHSSGGSDLIYILDEENKESIRKRLKPLLAKLEGVERVLDVDEFTRYGLPNPHDNPEQADLMLAAKPGYSFGGSLSGNNPIEEVGERRGSHGHLPDPHYMHATFLAVGAGIKPGVKLKTVSNLDVAPTIARLLGVKLPTAEGRVLTEILNESSDAR